MPRRMKSGVLSKLMQRSARAGFMRAYHTLQIDPQKYLSELKRSDRLPIHTWTDMFHVDEKVVERLANGVIKSATRTAGLEGGGGGGCGVMSSVPGAGDL